MLGLGYLGNRLKDNFGGIPISPNNALGLATSTQITSTSTSQKILATAPQAQFRSFSNVGPYDAWISPTSTGLAVGTGLWIKASSTVIFSGDSLYTGDWYGIGTGTTSISTLQL